VIKNVIHEGRQNDRRGILAESYQEATNWQQARKLHATQERNSFHFIAQGIVFLYLYSVFCGGLPDFVVKSAWADSTTSSWRAIEVNKTN
jgi:hypothetical protein